MQTEWIVSQKTNNLVVAAQFLGTSVPILALGLVKGAMAFTEFVSHGIGSSFAAQAGASAASGNLSMGNISMDQVSANKYNTAMSSTVGFQDVQAFTNAGAMQQNLNLGGTTATANGAAKTQAWADRTEAGTGKSASDGYSVKADASTGASASTAVSSGHNDGVSRDTALRHSAGERATSGNRASVGASGGADNSAGSTHSSKTTAATQQAKTAQVNAGGSIAPTGPGGGGGGGGGVGGGAGGAGAAAGGSKRVAPPVKAGGTLGTNVNATNTATAVQQADRSVDHGHKVHSGTQAAVERNSSHEASRGTEWTGGNTASHSDTGARVANAGTGHGTTDGAGHVVNGQTSMDYKQSQAETESGNNNITAAWALRAHHSGSIAGISALIDQENAALHSAYSAVRQHEENAIATAGDAIAHANHGLAGASFSPAGIPGVHDYSGEARNAIKGYGAETQRLGGTADANYKLMSGAVDNAVNKNWWNPMDMPTASADKNGLMSVGESKLAAWATGGVVAGNLIPLGQSLFGDIRALGQGGAAAQGGGLLARGAAVLGSDIAAVGAAPLVLGTGVALGTGWAVGSAINKYVLEGTAAGDWIGEKVTQGAAFLGSSEAQDALRQRGR